MPYYYKKVDNKYCVYKKSNNEKVGCTDGDKESLNKYLAALAIAHKRKRRKKIKEQLKDLATQPDGKKIYVGTKYAVKITSRTDRAFDYAKLEAETSLTKAALDAYKTILSTTIVASSSPLE